MKIDFSAKQTIFSARVFLVIFYAVGIAGFSMPLTFSLFQKLVPLNLIISTVILFLFHPKWDIRQVAVFFVLALSGLVVEMVGTHTGLIFGSYTYGNSLGLKILSTPLLIGVNWLVLVYCVHAILPQERQKWFYPFIGAALLVAFDYVMEPVAIATDMWSWAGESIPVKNYLAWYALALILLFVLRFAGIRYKNAVAGWLLVIQFLFFLVLNWII
jgi:bisanhydrobacterioruberin hydratase